MDGQPQSFGDVSLSEASGLFITSGTFVINGVSKSVILYEDNSSTLKIRIPISDPE